MKLGQPQRALALLSFVALLAGCGPTQADEPPARVVLLGIDGADWRLIDGFIDAGKLPNFARLKREGAHGDLLTLKGEVSPTIWTTVSTGMPPETHGIPGWTIQHEGEEKIPTSNMIRVPTLWEILTASGASSTVIGWLVSWPAFAIEGRMVTSYSHLGGPRGKRNIVRNPMKGSLVSDVPAQTYPPELLEQLAPLQLAPEDLEAQDLARFVDDPLDDGDPIVADLLHGLRQAYAADVTYSRVAAELFEGERAALEVVYFGGVDVVSHRFWRFMDPSLWPTAEPLRERFGRAIPAYYELMDEELGRMLERLDARTTLLVCSDHGFRPKLGDESQLELTGREISGKHDDFGILAIYGAGVAAGTVIEGASVYDVCPTVLHLLGRPVAEDMPGRVLTEAFTASAPVTRVASYRDTMLRESNADPMSTIHDEELLEKLRSLGYIE